MDQREACCAHDSEQHNCNSVGEFLCFAGYTSFKRNLYGRGDHSTIEPISQEVFIKEFWLELFLTKGEFGINLSIHIYIRHI